MAASPARLGIATGMNIPVRDSQAHGRVRGPRWFGNWIPLSLQRRAPSRSASFPNRMIDNAGGKANISAKDS